jgi:hypothetical protein
MIEMTSLLTFHNCFNRKNCDQTIYDEKCNHDESTDFQHSYSMLFLESLQQITRQLLYHAAT